MSLLEKIRYVLRARKPVGELVKEISTIKSGWKTPGFWITILGTGISIVAAFQGLIPTLTALIISVSLTAGYNILRGLYKADQPGVTPVWTSSEVWVTIITQLSTALLALQTGGISAPWLVTAISILSGAAIVARDLANVDPTSLPAPEK